MVRFALRAASVAAALLLPPAARAQDLAPSPAELREVFERYTAFAGIDPATCRFGVWDRNIAAQTDKPRATNAFARCPAKPGAKVCTRLAAELKGQLPVTDGCIGGFDTVALSPVVALTPKGGFFVVLHEAAGQPLKVSQQLTLGFWPDRDFCEMSARLLDADGKVLAGGRYHDFMALIKDETLCRRPSGAPRR
jgi:hypothetical protein